MQVLCTFGCIDRLFQSVTGRGPREPGKRIHGASAETSNSVGVGEQEQMMMM